MKKLLNKVFHRHPKAQALETASFSTAGQRDAEVEPTQATKPASASAHTSETVGTSLGVSGQLWSNGFEKLRERDEKLIEAYMEVLGARPDAGEGPLSNPDNITALVERIQEEHSGKRLTFEFRGEQHKYRDQFRKAVGVAVFADSLVKQALSTQPYAALAWTGVSLFLPVCAIGF